ncbi:hypothetical protein GCM10010234_79040 [Streptomyces hawaiiensis]
MGKDGSGAEPELISLSRNPTTARIGSGDQNQLWVDGTVRHQVEADLRGDTTVSIRMYQWPQQGLRAMRRPRA